MGVTVTLLMAACSNTELPSPTGTSSALPSSLESAQATTSQSPTPVAGGCGGTQVFAGPGPDAALGLADNPWAPADPSDAGIVAYFWYPPPNVLFASGPSDDGTKILWILHKEQSGHLVVAAHPLDATTPVVHFDFPAASSPTGVPSSIDLPSAGCWHFDLTIGAAQADLDLLVAPARSTSP